MVIVNTIVIGIILEVLVASYILHKKKKDTIEVRFKDSVENTEIPIITLKSGNAKMNFIIDTGSNTNLLNMRAVAESDLKCSDIEEHKEFKCVTASGNTDGVSTFKTQVELSLDKDHSYSYPFVLMDLENSFNSVLKKTGIVISGILGTDFLDLHKVKIDYDKDVIKLNIKNDLLCNKTTTINQKQ